ncbi:MAG: hypothetical protein BAA02_13780 [Paenibacillaceae bacterium ZCTH02-B3]|nr:MAG: hypothetical protein BAA02_13780 [Paenibacillaceae bacterium ZCTH02-B3]
MKKGLSLLLAFAMVFSMFASVAFAADNNLTTEQKYQWFVDQGVLKGYPDGDPRLGNNLTRAEFATIAVAIAGLEPKTDTETFSDVKSGQWWHGAIEAAAAAGLVNGVGGGKFDPRSNVTLEQVIAVAVRILGLDPVEDANVPGASAWAAGYVQAALDAGLITPQSDYKVAATRGQTIDIVYPTYQSLQLNVESATVLDAKTVEVKFTDGSVVKVTLDQPLPANQEQEITVKHEASGKEFKVKVTYVVEKATKVESVTADNLREVLVTFDGKVEKEVAEDVANYLLDEAALAVGAQAKVQDDEKSVLLYLNTTLTNQTKHKLTVRKVIENEQTAEFTVLDTTVPKVISIAAKGNKAIKVTFSEPVKTASGTDRLNYKLDGYIVNGNITLDKFNRVATISLYSSMSNGEHKLSVSGVRDFADYPIVNVTDQAFTVVEDKEAPKIDSVVSATLDYVTVKFTEEVTNVNKDNIYWSDNGGTTKHKARAVSQVDELTWKFDFTSDRLPARATKLYIENVEDLSGNKIAAGTYVDVNPTVDTVRPEITYLDLRKNADGKYDPARNVLEIKFNKDIGLDQFDATRGNADNLVVKDSDNKIVAKANSAVYKTDTNGNNITNTLLVSLTSALAETKTYTIEVKNVRDTTALANVMIPQTFTISVPKISAPQAISAFQSGLKIQVNFDSPMALGGDGSVLDAQKYMVKYSGSWYTLPYGTTIAPSYDNKSVIIEIPSTARIDGINQVNPANIQGIKVTLVKDANGNTLAGLTKEFSPFTAQALEIVKAELTESKKVVVEFNRPLSYVSHNDFVISGAVAGTTVTGAEYKTDNGKGIVTLTLSTDNYTGFNLSTVATPATTGLIGDAIRAGQTIAVVDKVKPKLVNNGVSYNPTTEEIELTFTEDIQPVDPALSAHTLANDFVVTYGFNDDKLTPGTDYTVALNGTKATISIIKPGFNQSVVKVSTADTVKYIVDGNNNTIDSIASQTVPNVTAAGVPAIVSATLAANNSYVDITFSEGVWGDDSQGSAVEESDLNLVFSANGGTATNVEIASVTKTDGSPLAGGETTIRVYLTVTGTPDGKETIVISPAANSIYDAAGRVAPATVSTGVINLNP